MYISIKTLVAAHLKIFKNYPDQKRKIKIDKKRKIKGVFFFGLTQERIRWIFGFQKRGHFTLRRTAKFDDTRVGV